MVCEPGLRRELRRYRARERAGARVLPARRLSRALAGPWPSPTAKSLVCRLKDLRRLARRKASEHGFVLLDDLRPGVIFLGECAPLLPALRPLRRVGNEDFQGRNESVCILRGDQGAIFTIDDGVGD